MDNDKAFAVYALILTLGVTSVIAGAFAAGWASFATPLAFVEHLALGLLFRAAYKGIGGFDPTEWSISIDRTGEKTAVAEGMAHPGSPAEAAS